MLISFQTFGCKLNFSETATISQQLQDIGFSIVDSYREADVHVIHSCTVTEHAEKKCRQAIRHIVKENPNVKIVVMGCYSQLRPSELQDLPNVVFVCGNETKFKLPEILKDIVAVEDKKEDNKLETNDFIYHSAVSQESRTRAFMKIQDGCDYFCTYCAIPYARGRSRSDSVKNVVDIARKTVEGGKKEIVLSGVNLGDFGRKNSESFYELLVELINIDKLERLRISSIEPNLLESRILDLCTQTNKIMPHFHIPLQSGSDKILKLMRRKYDTGFFRDKVAAIKEIMPLSCIAIDLITGFPGETTQDFDDTIKFLDSTGVSYLHIFSYSDRPEAASSKYQGKVSNEEISRRSKVLHKFSEDKWNGFLSLNKGTTHKVLFETLNDVGEWTGWTDNYIEVNRKSDENLYNMIVDVVI